jgi:SAM-dependent methyltransferase
MSADASICAACGSRHLGAHMRVAGEMGEQGLIPTTDAFGTALADIVRCADCGHMQLERFPVEAVLEQAYGDAASTDYVEEEAGQRATARRTIAEIERFVPRGSLLDLGCWVGYLLDEAGRAGWTALGVEPSDFAAAYARDQLGLDVVHASMEDAELDLSAFDAVFMGDVIEHLLDPAGALDRVAKLLAPGGVVALAVPNAGSRLARLMGPRWWSVIPTHVQYFTRRSIGTLLARRGYEPLWFGTSPKAFTVRYYLERIGGYSPSLARGLVAAARATGLAERIWAPDFGDRMLVIARAPGCGPLTP